ncbi:hypothetical protein E4U32_007731 [Claviceps aff. humidiphila group G2b]|nr:hypothetical protein E4U32_007731 [Claviceps aff. humidiphila group G2b]
MLKSSFALTSHFKKARFSSYAQTSLFKSMRFSIPQLPPQLPPQLVISAHDDLTTYSLCR